MENINQLAGNQELIQICKNFILPKTYPVVIKEPYLPFVPYNWNGILVLAEAQNLSQYVNRYDNYIQELNSWSEEDKILRLGKRGPNLDIQPWDDFSIRIALLAMIPNINIEEVAVSNAVPWSLTKELVANDNPSKEMISKAIAFWKEIFDKWNPKLKKIIALGRVAERVMAGAGKGDLVFKLLLPAPRNLNNMMTMFDSDDLLQRYPEVKSAMGKLSLDKNAPYLKRKILFACHAVSRGKKVFDNFFR